MAEPRRMDEPAKGPRRNRARPQAFPRDPRRKAGASQPRPADASPREEAAGSPEAESEDAAPRPEPEHKPEDAAWDYREPQAEMEAHQAEDVPPSPRGHRVPPESRVGPGQGDRPQAPGGGVWAEASHDRPTARRRPVGLVLVMALLGLNGLSSLGMLATLLAAGGGAPMAVGGSGLMVGAGLTGLLSLVLAYGLWTWRKWGWWGTLAATVIGTALGLGALVAAGLGAAVMPGNLIGVVIGVAVIWYLTRPPLKALFGVGTSSADRR